MKKSPLTIKPIVLACSLALAGCGGGGSGTTDPGINPDPDPVSTSLTGTAAAGAAIIGTVTVKGALGMTKSALIEADGTYDVDVTGLTAPYRLRAQGTVGGKTYKLHSYAEAADVGGTVNITPFTDLIIANAAQQIAASYFDDDVLDDTEVLDPAELDAQEDALQAKLQDVLDALGVETAIDLLNSTFSADHSGLDAALDIIQIESTSNNIVTITNLLDDTTISDDITDSADSESFVVDAADVENYTEAVSDNVAIAGLFESFAAEFAAGLPSQANIEDYFTADFLLGDQTLGEFLTDITTDPSVIGLGFTGVSISDLDSTAGTAAVTFNVVFGGEIDPEIETWFVAKDATLGWQLLGDQRIVDLEALTFHCNDYDGRDDQPGGCGINAAFWDENFTNNGTGGVPIASGTVSIIDGTDGVTVKDIVYLGTPEFVAPGEVQIYNEATGEYQGDWKEFGTGLGQIDPTIFSPGDIIEYDIYTQDLNISSPTTPSVAIGTEIATYTNALLFSPSTTGLYPTATAATLTALDNFTIGSDLTVAWTLADGTVSDEVLVEITDSVGNRFEIWDESFASTATSTTFSSSSFSATELENQGFDPNATSFTILVRIYAADAVTGQAHSTDYRSDISTATATDPSLTCGFETPWDDINDEPSSFNSYTDFEAVVADCNGPLAMTAVDVIGTWTNTWTDFGVEYVETIVFDATGGTGTFTETEGGVVIETVPFSWSVANNLLTLTASVGDVSIMEMWALTGANSFTVYTEQSNWSSSPDLSTLDGTAEGEVWTTSLVKQQ